MCDGRNACDDGRMSITERNIISLGRFVVRFVERLEVCVCLITDFDKDFADIADIAVVLF